jgi:uncharacterized protein (TIGR02996 family)
MTDDEGFIRAIVDSPGDEAPRLVYADWLEERGDPRAAYLRAEQEAVRTGDSSKMQQLAPGLDPVWVARVTMPPLGVCCEHVEIRERGLALWAQDLEAFEQRSGITLPDDYRAFLLNYNGGVAGKVFYEPPTGERFYPWEHQFYSMDKLEERVAARSDYLARHFAEEGPDPLVEAWFLQFVTIGCTPDWQQGLLLGVAGSEFGQVRYFDYNSGLYPEFLEHIGVPYARSFAEYLAVFLDPAKAGRVTPLPGHRSGEDEDEIPF